MNNDNVKLLAAFMTAHSKDHDEASAIGHSVMNKVMNGMFTGNIADSTPSISGDEKDKFFKILNGQSDKDDRDIFKRNIIKASAIMSGRIKDMTNGADSFSKGKTKGALHYTDNYSFTKSSPTEGVSSGTIKSKSGKSRKTLKG